MVGISILGVRVLGDRNNVLCRSLVAAAMVVLLGVFTSAALASPRKSQYDNPAIREPVKSVVLGKKTTTIAKVSSKPVAAAPQQSSSGSLPFTGLNLILIVGLGGTLLASGFVLRAAGRKRDDNS